MADPIPLNADFVIGDEADLDQLFHPANDFVTEKVLDYIHEHARVFIERSPFMLIGSQSANGDADVSPRGDPQGFCLLYTSPSPRDQRGSRMPSSA